MLWTREESIQGGVDGVVKVDVGQPIEPTLEGSAKAIATRFDGELTWLADRPIAWIQTRSTTIDLPRHCFTASVDDEVYFVFLASNGPAIADQAAIAVRESLRLASVPPTSSTRKASVEQLRSSNRTWADSTGRHKVNARLVRLDNDVVTLRKANGREVTLPFDRLSDEDRTLLEDARDAPENLSE
ncbi:MAG: SHD1 domain-containing protein [Planctomycetota bacterium]